MYHAFVTLRPDCRQLNSLGAGVVKLTVQVNLFNKVLGSARHDTTYAQ